VLINGVTVTVKVAHVRLCHSRMLVVRAYPRETQEMVFDAHDCQSALDCDSISACKRDPGVRFIPVVHRRDPRATRSALTSDEAARVGGSCAPTGVTRGGGGPGAGVLSFRRGS
jgi:hypothetical protein